MAAVRWWRPEPRHEIIGSTQVTVVEAANWAAAFGLLEHAELPVALAGRTLAGARRHPRRSPPGPRCGPAQCRPRTASTRPPATLEERFFELAGCWPGAGSGMTSPGRRAGPSTRRPGSRRGPEHADRPPGRGQRYPRGDPRRPPARSSPSTATTVPRSGDRRSRRRRPGAGAPLLRHQGAAVRSGDAAAGRAERGHQRRAGRAGPAALASRPASTWSGRPWRYGRARRSARRFLALLRSALTSEQAAVMLREFLAEAILGPMASLAAGGDPQTTPFRAS